MFRIGIVSSVLFLVSSLELLAQSSQPVTTLGAVAELYHEGYRPQFHFTAAKNWINDPNGLVYYQGEYHLFFQHNPFAVTHGHMTWGHAVSTDLVHWTQLMDAIRPDERGDIWSGSAVVDENNTAGLQKGDEKTLIAFYTAAGGLTPQASGVPVTQCMAYSNDRGRTWIKYAGNPVVEALSNENRDPKVVWHAGAKKWIMALYIAGTKYMLLSSSDLKKWTPMQDVVFPPGCGECPDFFEMPIENEPGQKRWILTAANGQYLVGNCDGSHFEVVSGPHRVDWGKNYYAVQTFSDIPPSDGRRIQLAWMAGGEYPGMPFNQQMSFPSEMRLFRFPEGLRICRLPVREIENLYVHTHTWTDTMIKPGDNLLNEVKGELFDIVAEIEPKQVSEISFMIRGEPIRYHVVDRQLTCLGQSAEIPSSEDRKLKLRILVDRTSIEVFANEGRVAMAFCFLPQPDNKTLAISVTDGSARISVLKVHELRSAWENTDKSASKPAAN